LWPRKIIRCVGDFRERKEKSWVDDAAWGGKLLGEITGVDVMTISGYSAEVVRGGKQNVRVHFGEGEKPLLLTARHLPGYCFALGGIFKKKEGKFTSRRDNS